MKNISSNFRPAQGPGEQNREPQQEGGGPHIHQLLRRHLATTLFTCTPRLRGRGERRGPQWQGGGGRGGGREFPGEDRHHPRDHGSDRRLSHTILEANSLQLWSRSFKAN